MSTFFLLWLDQVSFQTNVGESQSQTQEQIHKLQKIKQNPQPIQEQIHKS